MLGKAAKLAMKLRAGLSIGCGCIINIVKDPEVTESSVGLDLRAPLLRPGVPSHAFDARSIRRRLSLVSLVFRTRGDAEIDAAVVQAITINMVALPVILNSKDGSVQKNARPGPTRNGQSSVGINCVWPNQRGPVKPINKRNIDGIYDRDKALCKRYEGVKPFNADGANTSGHLAASLAGPVLISQAAHSINQRVS